MEYNVETPNESSQYINSSFVKKIEEGRIKEAEVQGSTFLRLKMRQSSFAREILPPKDVREDQIDRGVTSDQPRVIVEKEPDSYAKMVPFKGTGDQTWFSGPRYEVVFGKVESQRFSKSKFELMTYSNDIRKILSDNSVLDMSDQEDGKFIEAVEDCIGHETGLGTVSDLVRVDNFMAKRLAQKLIRAKKPVGKLLMTLSTFYGILDMDAQQVSHDIVKGQYRDGIEQEKKLWGIPVVTTIKNDIIDDGMVYAFAPDNWVGNFFLLQDATLFIKQEADIITFWSYSAPGIGLGTCDAFTRTETALNYEHIIVPAGYND